MIKTRLPPYLEAFWEKHSVNFGGNCGNQGYPLIWKLLGTKQGINLGEEWFFAILCTPDNLQQKKTLIDLFNQIYIFTNSDREGVYHHNLEVFLGQNNSWIANKYSSPRNALFNFFNAWARKHPES